MATEYSSSDDYSMFQAVTFDSKKKPIPLINFKSPACPAEKFVYFRIKTGYYDTGYRENCAFAGDNSFQKPGKRIGYTPPIMIADIPLFAQCEQNSTLFALNKKKGILKLGGSGNYVRMVNSTYLEITRNISFATKFKYNPGIVSTIEIKDQPGKFLSNLDQNGKTIIGIGSDIGYAVKLVGLDSNYLI